MKKIIFIPCLILIIFLCSTIKAVGEDYYNNKILNWTYNYLPSKIKSKIDKDYFYSGYNKSIIEIEKEISFIEAKDKNKWLFEICQAKINEIIFLNNFHPTQSLLSYQLGKLAGYITIVTNPFKEKDKIFESLADEFLKKKINFSYNQVSEITKENLINRIEETADLNLFDAEQLEERYNLSGNTNDKKMGKILSRILNRTTSLIKDEIHSIFIILENEETKELTIRDFLPLPKSNKTPTIKKPDAPTPPSKPELKQPETKNENKEAE